MRNIKKSYWEMNTEELQEATKEFDDPNYHPPAIPPPPEELAKHRAMEKKRAAHSRMTVLVETKLIERTDDYAATHGVTFADVVTEALNRYMKPKAKRTSPARTMRLAKRARTS